MISAEFTFDESFLMESHARFKRQRNRRTRVIVPGVIAVVFLMLASIFLIYSGEAGMGITPILFMAVAVSALMYEPWSIKRQMRKSPFNDQKIELKFSEESFEAISPIAKSSLKWRLFTKVAHFSDAVLLFQGPQEFNWIPYDTLIAGSADQLEDLLRRKITEHQIVEL